MKPEDLHELKYLGWLLIVHHSDGWLRTFFFMVAAFHGFMAILWIIRGAKK